MSDGGSCPWCGESGIPVLFGFPTPNVIEAARAGRVALGGCVVWGDGRNPQWQCRRNEDHRWTGGGAHSPEWQQTVTKVLDEQPG